MSKTPRRTRLAFIRRHLPGVLALASSLAASTACWAAFEFSGTKTITAVTANGARTPIGTIQFEPEGDGVSAFRITLKTEAFTDHFLSMREFKCLPGDKEISCHVPYPYPNPAKAGPGNLAWLEHGLLFLHKSPGEFGAKLWNGLYFEFSDRGASLVGTPMAIDLNEISAPPGNPSVPPFKKALRHEVSAGSRWITELVIE